MIAQQLFQHPISTVRLLDAHPQPVSFLQSGTMFGIPLYADRISFFHILLEDDRALSKGWPISVTMEA